MGAGEEGEEEEEECGRTTLWWATGQEELEEEPAGPHLLIRGVGHHQQNNIYDKNSKYNHMDSTNSNSDPWPYSEFISEIKQLHNTCFWL